MSRRIYGPNIAPISFTRCPVHARKVARDGEGRLLGVCDACVAESVRAMRRLSLMRKASIA